MSDKFQVADVSEPKTAATSRNQTSLLQDIIVMIRRDSVEETEQYLDETNVPHGGE